MRSISGVAAQHVNAAHMSAQVFVRIIGVGVEYTEAGRLPELLFQPHGT